MAAEILSQIPHSEAGWKDITISGPVVWGAIIVVLILGVVAMDLKFSGPLMKAVALRIEKRRARKITRKIQRRSRR